MSDTEIQRNAGDIRALMNGYKVLETEYDKYKDTDTWLQRQASLEQTIKDTNQSTLNSQRSEIDTKSRIMTYAENDMKRNFDLLNSQYIILIALLCMVVFVILWGIFEFVVDRGSSQSVMQTVGGGIRSFFSMK